MLKISDVSIDLDQHDYKGKIASMLNLRKSKIHHVKLVKQGVDARRKNHVHFNCAFTFETENEAQVIKNNPKKKLTVVKDYHYPLLKPNHQKVVVVGSGPAGLFCAYNLARSGQKVTLIERGKPVDQRNLANCLLSLTIAFTLGKDIISQHGSQDEILFRRKLA